jgi:hypothetical protein
MFALRRSLASLLVAIALTPGLALADEADGAKSRQAQALFDRGRDMMASGDIAQACALLAESQRLDPGGGTLLNVAVCHEKQGRLATAWTEYHEALSTSIRDDRKDRQSLASERIAAIEARLPHLVVVLPPNLPQGTQVTVDGAPLSRLATGAPLPVDPGPHEVVVTAPGYPSWSRTLDSVSEGQNVEVQVPAFTLPRAPELPKAHGIRLSTGSYVAGGVAIAGYAIMGITGGLALAAQSSADHVCNMSSGYCSDTSGPSDASRARTLAWVSTVSLGAAMAATVIAIVWPRAHDAAPGVGVNASGLWAAF